MGIASLALAILEEGRMMDGSIVASYLLYVCIPPPGNRRSRRWPHETHRRSKKLSINKMTQITTTRIRDQWTDHN